MHSIVRQEKRPTLRFPDLVKLAFADSTSRRYLVRRYLLGPVIRLASIVLYLVYPLLPQRVKTLDRPVFVIGCSRSGTDLFTDLLAMHQELANWSEAAQILDLRYYNSNHDHYLTEKNATPFETRRLRAFFGLYTWLQGKKRFLNKHPQNTVRIRYLRAIFPDAYFIHVIRDGRAVIHSNYKPPQQDQYRAYCPFGNFPKPIQWRQYMNDPPITQFAHQWRDLVEYAQEACRELDEKHYLEVTYEALCEDALSTLAKADAFIGVNPDQRLSESVNRPLKPQNYKWRADFHTDDLAQIDRVAGDLLQHLGYTSE